MILLTVYKIEEFLAKSPESVNYIATLFRIIEECNWDDFNSMKESLPTLEGKPKNASITIGCGLYIVRLRIDFELKQVVVRSINEQTQDETIYRGT